MRGLKSGKKDLIKKENAVSEIMGVALLLGIVVIMISFEGAFIFARGAPDDLPHAKLQEWMDTSEEKIYLKHCNGEPINTKELEIVANINGKSYVCNSSNVSAGVGDNGYWELGETFEIDTVSEWGLDIKDYDEVDLYLIDTPTKDLIQKNRLTTDFRKAPYTTGWITPSGGVKDTSGGSATLADVQRENDSFWTIYMTPTKDGDDTDPNIYQEIDFGVNPCMYGYRPGDSLSNVTLKIVYTTNDNSLLKIQLRFYDVDGSSNWFYKEIILPEKNAFTATYIPLTGYISTTEDLANFTVRLEAVTNADENSKKEVNIDYLGLWIE